MARCSLSSSAASKLMLGAVSIFVLVVGHALGGQRCRRGSRTLQRIRHFRIGVRFGGGSRSAGLLGSLLRRDILDVLIARSCRAGFPDAHPRGLAARDRRSARRWFLPRRNTSATAFAAAKAALQFGF